jgi:hypothetical protein
VLIWALLFGCLERVTGIAVPLDPRFYEDLGQIEAGMGMSHGDGAQAVPFSDYEGDTVTVSGAVEAQEALAVELDVRVPDSEAEGGMRGVGRISLDEPGSFAFEVPVDLGTLNIQAFQDPDADGPGGDDGFAEVEITVGDEDWTDVALVLRSYADREPLEGLVAHVSGAHPLPFSDYEGDTVTVSGTVEAEDSLAVELDVRVPDPEEEGGMRGVGKVSLAEPGSFAFEVPADLGTLNIQAFQDPDADGPGGDDGFAEIEIIVSDEDVIDVALVLIRGARGGSPEHTLAPPGAGSGQGSLGSSGSSQSGDPFADYEGERVQVSGTLVWAGEDQIDVDLFQPDASAPGGRNLLGKLKHRAGSFQLMVPVELGTLEIEAMVDTEGDGPSASDPRAVYAGNPISLDQGDVSGVDLFLALVDGGPGAVAPAPDEVPSSVDDEFSATREAAGGDGSTDPNIDGN